MWFYMTEKRKERKLIHILIPNSLLNAVLCHSWLLSLILFFPAFSFRLLLKSCCWESQWGWSVILCQITTMLVGFLEIFVSAPQSKPGIPGWSMGSPCHSLLSAAGMAAFNRDDVGSAKGTPRAICCKFSRFIHDWQCTEALHPCCCGGFYRIDWLFFSLNWNLTISSPFKTAAICNL